jgi:hypothetical protein
MECAPDAPIESLSHSGDEYIDEDDDIETQSVTLVTPSHGDPPNDDDIHREETGEAAENHLDPRCACVVIVELKLPPINSRLFQTIIRDRLP